MIIATPWAYQKLADFPEALNGQPGRAEKLIGLLQNSDLKAAGQQLYNSLEAPALHKYPLLVLFKDFLQDHGAAGALMSGSGSTTFAVCPTKMIAERVLEEFKTKFGTTYWTTVVEVSKQKE